MSGGDLLQADEPFVGNYFVSVYPPFSTWTKDNLHHVERVLGAPSHNAGQLGLYVHVPSCVERCQYCYYLSYADKSSSEVGGVPGRDCAKVDALSRSAGAGRSRIVLCVFRRRYSVPFVGPDDRGFSASPTGNPALGPCPVGADIPARLADTLAECARRGWLTFGTDGVTMPREGLVRVDRLIPAFYPRNLHGVRYT